MSDRTTPSVTTRQLTLAAYRARQRRRHVLVAAFFAVWFGGVGLADSAERREREVGLRQALASGGIPLNLGDRTVTVDSAVYPTLRALFEKEGVSEDDFEKVLWRSHMAGSQPPPMATLAAQQDPVTGNAWLVMGGVLVVIIAYATRRSPPRIALLRPFGTATVSKGLRRVSRRHLSGWGHVVTLSDRYLSHPGWLRRQFAFREWFSPGMLLAPFGLLMWPLTRQVTPRFIVKKAQDVATLDAILKNTFNLNFFAAFSFLDPIRKVSSIDALWHPTVDKVLDHASLIVIDLSAPKPGVLWELERVAARRLEARTVFVALALEAGRAGAPVGLALPLEPTRVHLYSSSGTLADEPAFADAVAAVLSGQPAPAR